MEIRRRTSLLPEPGRVTATRNPVIPQVRDLILANPGTLSLGQGVVYYPPPPAAMEEMARVLLTTEVHRYCAVEGLPELRDALIQCLARRHGIHLTADQELLVTAGGNLAFAVAVQAVADPGEGIALFTPYYFNHDMAITLAGCTTMSLETDSASLPLTDRLQRSDLSHCRAIVTTSPNNPTGAVYSEATLRAVNNYCASNGMWHIHDAAYDEFVYTGETCPNPLQFAGVEEHTIALFSFSKAFGMAGWRLGYMVAPRRIVNALRKVLDTLQICPPVASQHVGLAALGSGDAWLEAHIGTLKNVRDNCLQVIRSCAPWCTVSPADGAFYMWLRVQTSLDDWQVVRRLVEEHGVAVLPGSAFNASTAREFRVSYGCLEPDQTAAALSRLMDGLHALHKECPL